MASYNIQIEDSAGNKYYPRPDLLTTKEQVSANTASGKSADALVVKGLINNLNDIKLISEGSGANVKYYAQLGADAASKKRLGSGTIALAAYDMKYDTGGKASAAYTATEDCKLLVICSTCYPRTNYIKCTVNQTDINMTAVESTTARSLEYCIVDVSKGNIITATAQNGTGSSSSYTYCTAMIFTIS